MTAYHEIITGLKQLDLNPDQPVIAHASLSAFGDVRGGVESLMGALLSVANRVMMPAFTYKTMVIPEEGPPDNAIAYGSGREANRMAEFFNMDMPVDRLMGVLPEALRHHPQAKRSNHPILSFTGIGVEDALNAQNLMDPLAPIQTLAEQKGWVLMLGVDHSVNTSLHLAERLAGRKQFTRWGLALSGIYECPGFPGCSLGFNQAGRYLQTITRTIPIGSAMVRALPLQPMIQIISEVIKTDPQALLCNRPGCERCSAVRAG